MLLGLLIDGYTDKYPLHTGRDNQAGSHRRPAKQHTKSPQVPAGLSLYNSFSDSLLAEDILTPVLLVGAIGLAVTIVVDTVTIIIGYIIADFSHARVNVYIGIVAIY